MNATSSRLIAALTYPRTLDDFVELVLPLQSTREIRARVLEVRKETHDVATLVLRPSGRLRPHRAGQHVIVTAEIDGVRRARCFSIASGERARGEKTIEVTVKALPGGAVTPRIVSGELRGKVVTLSQPEGEFVLPVPVPPRVLLMSGGSGITPLMSMLRTLIARGHAGEVTFLHWARSEADVVFQDELSRIAREAPLSTRVIVRTGMFRAEQLAIYVPDFDQHDAWVCGPSPFMDAVTGAFAARGARDRVRIERFSLSAAPAAGDGEVSFVRSGRRGAGGGPILEIAERAGLSPASGCRMGLCHSCVCRKVSGTTRDLRTGALSSDADVDVQLCVSAPVGPVEIDL